MRIDESTEVAAPAETVWHYLEDPENYLRFMSGITRWEVAGEHPNGLGARYRILVRIGAAEVGGLIEMVEWNEPFDIAWHSVTGVDHRGRWRIRERGEGRARIEYRFAYGVVGGGIAGWSPRSPPPSSCAARCGARCASSSARSNTSNGASKPSAAAPLVSRSAHAEREDALT